MAKRERYLWVCQNRRPPGNPKGSCAASGSAAVLHALRTGIGDRGLHRRFRVLASDCLDLCWVGPSIAVMPDALFYGRVRPEDVPEILDSLERGTVVDRLVVPEEELTAPEKRGRD